MTCKNCGGEMRSSAIGCGGSPYHEYSCSTCGRRERTHGFGTEVRMAGRKKHKCQLCGHVCYGIGHMIDHVSEDHPGQINEALEGTKI